MMILPEFSPNTAPIFRERASPQNQKVCVDEHQTLSFGFLEYHLVFLYSGALFIFLA